MSFLLRGSTFTFWSDIEYFWVLDLTQPTQLSWDGELELTEAAKGNYSHVQLFEDKMVAQTSELFQS